MLGRTLAGKYRLQAVQGAGFYSVVFAAEQRFCGVPVRPVAVKVSRQTGLTEETAPHLFGDALILARLLAGSDHEGRRHLVQIHDMGLLPEYDGRAYLVMEHVDGLPLLAHLQAAGRFSVAAGLRFLEQVCLALALVHAQGAIHRDLIPQNILIDRRGRVRVVDFGLAAYTDPRVGFAPGAAGTFCYMAPETVLGRSLPASDVYSLGLLMYELFTGGGPHLTAPWATDEKAERSRENHRLKTALRFAPPSEFQNEIRNDYRWLDGLILRCLDADPARRPADAGALLRALQAHRAGESPPEEEAAATPPASPPTEADAAGEALFREVRRLLARRDYAAVIDRLDVYRPAEWSVVDRTAARALRALGQAYLGRDDLGQARDCLEQLRGCQRERPLLPAGDYAAALSDLVKVYRRLGLAEQAQACLDEVKHPG